MLKGAPEPGRGRPRPERAPPAGADRAPPAEPAALTARGRELLRRSARGLSHPEIADLPSISEATAATHLYRTRAKLGLGSRAQAVVPAYETGLVTPRGGMRILRISCIERMCVATVG
ncbi:response regulator transcription factor [Actinacidiphila sp. bgisy160]|uniref:response regulator transcription factor n=1 Tax=Actinacidiphila sp. bgisy160 TaxID=3413796 RepID=UPI003D709328